MDVKNIQSSKALIKPEEKFNKLPIQFAFLKFYKFISEYFKEKCKGDFKDFLTILFQMPFPSGLE